MFNLVRWYNQNKGKFWITILIILGIIFFVQMANNFYKNDKSDTKTNTSSKTQDTIDNAISGKLESSSSLVGGSNVSGKNLQNQVTVIDEFIKYCNSGKVEEAYNLLTDECKEEVFPDLNSFRNKYYNKVFNTNKTYNVQNWMDNTYKLKLTEDALTTGKVGSNSSNLQEYVTVVKKGSEYKLNINNYIGRTDLDKTTTTKGITINVVNKETYMDYSVYTVKIQNHTGNTILLDNGEQTDSIYLLDENDVKEYVNTGEIVYNNLRLLAGETKTYNFKFSNSYSNTRQMKYLVFKNVIMDYDEYNAITNKSDYDKFTRITANV